jgi:hypothetical protein
LMCYKLSGIGTLMCYKLSGIGALMCYIRDRYIDVLMAQCESVAQYKL